MPVEEDEKEIGVEVPAQDDELPPTEEKGPDIRPYDPDDDKDKGIIGEKKEEEPTMSEEDLLLKETLETCVERLTDATSDIGVQKLALETLRKEIRSATASMTSVPKPLKFLRPHYDTLKDFYNGLNPQDNTDIAMALADVVSVLAMTMAAEGSRECLKFKLLGNRHELGEWGHEFVRAIAGEISQEYSHRTTSVPPTDVTELIKLVDDIVPFQMQHNSEAEAIDLLIEVDQIRKLVDTPDLVDKNNFKRVCLYLISIGSYLIELEDLEVLMKAAYDLYSRENDYTDALRVGIHLNNMDLITTAMNKAREFDPLMEQQMAFILGSSKQFAYTNDDDEENVTSIVSNDKLWEHFQTLARELNVEDAKTPEDVYKSHLSETGSLRREAAQVESAKQNLASTFVNAFVNVGFQKDALMTPEDSKWLYKNKDHGMLSAAASLGMVLLWNVDEGMSQIDKFLYSNEENIKAGALLALGIVNCGVRDECDPVFGMLPEYLEDNNPANIRLAAALGIGLAYAGNPKEEISEILIPVVSDSSATSNMEVCSIAGLAIGLIYVGTADEETATTIVARLMEASTAELDQSVARLLCVGLGLIFMGKQEGAEAIIEAVKTVEHPISKFAEVIIQTCAYAGTGNVLQVQHLLHLCAEHISTEKSDEDEEKAEGDDAAATGAAAATEGGDTNKSDADIAAAGMHQSAAVIGIALITMNESIGQRMAERTFQHLLQYGDAAVRRAVPLAIALSHISDPDYALIDVLSKLTHDADVELAMCAIIGLGIMGAGTNNSRVAGLLRQLATFYSKDANPLFVVRIAQGLLHAGKGLVTMSPIHSDKMLLSMSSLAGILPVLICCLDLKATLLGKFHFLLYTLVTCIKPRMLQTLDENLEPVQVTVRVGQAVDTVGQAGRPKTITGFQTHTTPVLLSVGERAELVGDDYKCYATVLEGLVVLKKNPKTDEDVTMTDAK